MEATRDFSGNEEDVSITDLNILWAIRDIHPSILNLNRKGILCLFLACIGTNKVCWYSMEQLELILGKSERRLRDDFHYLEDINFLFVKRPAKYSRGLSNEYRLNYKLILETAKKYKFDKIMENEAV